MAKEVMLLKKIKAGEGGMRPGAKIFSEEEPKENDNQQGEERIMN